MCVCMCVCDWLLHTPFESGAVVVSEALYPSKTFSRSYRIVREKSSARTHAQDPNPNMPEPVCEHTRGFLVSNEERGWEREKRERQTDRQERLSERERERSD
eukprot:GHVU01069377.1.p2 GENE.GHVU01069377.1~~GHVU01069377.1.p2  ORF type:complete len:102 (+),score=8.41 GHVU01069377.1:254-559(+)